MIDFDALVLAPALAAFGQAVIYYAGPPSPDSAPLGQLVLGRTPLGLANRTPPNAEVAAGNGVTLSGVFDESSGEQKLGKDGMLVTKFRPVLGMRMADLSAAGITPAQGDQITILGTLYSVTDAEPDSHGHVLLRLALA